MTPSIPGESAHKLCADDKIIFRKEYRINVLDYNSIYRAVSWFLDIFDGVFTLEIPFKCVLKMIYLLDE